MSGWLLNDIPSLLGAVLDDPERISGLLLYGSQAESQSDATSDVDLICVLRSKLEYQAREVKTYEGRHLDIYYASGPLLSKRLHMPGMTNNNFILNAFMGGRILVDKDRLLHQLSLTARKVWEKGPPLPPREQVRFIQQQLTASCLAIGRRLERSKDSPEEQELLRVRCSELFSKMVYEYCRRHGLWTNSIPRVMRWAEGNCQELFAPAHAYLTSRNDGERVEALMVLLRVLQEVGKVTSS